MHKTFVATDELIEYYTNFIKENFGEGAYSRLDIRAVLRRMHKDGKIIFNTERDATSV